MEQTGGFPVLNRYVKNGLLSGMLFLIVGMPAQACFPGYQASKFMPFAPGGGAYYLEKHNGKSYEQLISYNTANYQFDLQLAPLPVEQYQLIKMGQDLNDNYLGILGLYPLKANRIQGYVLLELTAPLDPCLNESIFIQPELQGKHRVFNYLPQLAIPSGLELQFYEQVKGKFVERSAVLVNPSVDTSVPPHSKSRYLVMSARYHIELEPYIKPEIQRYFESNIPQWSHSWLSYGWP